jgi:hypothetical protein
MAGRQDGIQEVKGSLKSLRTSQIEGRDYLQNDTGWQLAYCIHHFGGFQSAYNYFDITMAALCQTPNAR